jgi:hypothetical protein
MDGERTIAAKTRPRKRPAAEVAPAAEMPPTATEMPTASTAEMPAAVAATVKMPSTAVTTTVATTTVAPAAMTTAAMTTAATFRSSIARSRQRGRKNKDGNANIEF